mmetsp:Transcript_29570/g.60449  ORF Transcript_29570/g.60449 Transcript_29570/m.60449 type:complete len:287 (-) Transcript_29570:102-962(-)
MSGPSTASSPASPFFPFFFELTGGLELVVETTEESSSEALSIPRSFRSHGPCKDSEGLTPIAVTGNKVGKGFPSTHTTSVSWKRSAVSGMDHTVTSHVSSTRRSASFGSTKNTSRVGSRLEPEAMSLREGLVDTSKSNLTSASNWPLFDTRNVSALVFLVATCSWQAALSASLAPSPPTPKCRSSSLLSLGAFKLSPRGKPLGGAIHAVDFHVSKGPNSYTFRLITNRFGSGGALSLLAFTRLINTLRGSSLMVGTSHEPEHSSCDSRPGRPKTSNPNAPLNFPVT